MSYHEKYVYDLLIPRPSLLLNLDVFNEYKDYFNTGNCMVFVCVGTCCDVTLFVPTSRRV